MGDMPAEDLYAFLLKAKDMRSRITKEKVTLETLTQEEMVWLSEYEQKCDYWGIKAILRELLKK